jgi:hypothetical protein
MLQLPASDVGKAIPVSSRPIEDTTFDRILRHKALCVQMVSLWMAEEDLIATAREINVGQPLGEKPAGLLAINQKVDALAEERKNIMRSFIHEPTVSAKAASALIFYLLEMSEDGELDQISYDCFQAIARSLSTIGAAVS